VEGNLAALEAKTVLIQSGRIGMKEMKTIEVFSDYI